MLHGKVFVGLLVHGLFVTLALGEVIKIEDGKILGQEMKSRSGVSFYAFFKIPFAKPPIGELRFQAPVRNDPWDDTLNCTVFGPMCLQAGTEVGSEDCLQLNVFTKNLPSVNETVVLKPVIVYFHGGGFEGGTATNHGPEYLMDRDIILVTVQYRLGIFGFISVGRADVSGNQGLKDQTMSLRWVQENIHHFGGDKNRVTIAGISAGGISVTAHMVSAMSQGLFHNAIALSGSVTSQIRPETTNTDDVKTVAKKVKCATGNVDDMIDCLRKASAQQISKNMRITYLPCVVFAWTPLIEEDFGQERFLTDDPSVLFSSGNFSRVNIITGVTANELIAPAALILSNSLATILLNANWKNIAPVCFYFKGNEFTSKEEMTKILKESYFPFDQIDIRSINNLNNLFSDSMIGYGVHKFAGLVNTYIDTFYYKFSWVGQFSFFNFPRDKPYGVHHTDDIQYLFNVYLTPDHTTIAIPLNHTDSFVVERMTRIWEQFAWTGNPNKQNDEYLADMIWPTFNTNTHPYLDIGNHLVEKNGLFLERYTIWDKYDTNSTGFA